MRYARSGNLLAALAAVVVVGSLTACATTATSTPMAAPPTATPIPGATPVPVVATPTPVSPTGLAKLTSLPENPCDLLTVEQISAATGLQVTAQQRVPTHEEYNESLQAQRENRAPPAGSVCSYEMSGEFGSISLMLPSPEGRTSAAYWEARNTYFRGFAGSAQAIPGLGEDAWLGGGASLRVLVREGVWFTVSLQWPYVFGVAASRDLLVRTASAAISGEVPAAVAPPPTVAPRSPIPRPPTATPDPDRPPPTKSSLSNPLPTIAPPERESASDTRLYLTAFQNGFVSVVDPISGHALQQIPVDGDQAGVTVSPDGSRLYVTDGRQEGQLRVFDTSTWEVIHRQSLSNLSLMLGGNPIALSPDGRWLVLSFYDYERGPRVPNEFGEYGTRWTQVFDTERLEFLSGDPFEPDNCPGAFIGLFGLPPADLVGRPDGSEVYAQCQGSVAVLGADDLSPLGAMSGSTPLAIPIVGWPGKVKVALAVSPDGGRLLGLYPMDLGANLLLYAWDTRARSDPKVVRLNDQIDAPYATAGRGDAGYLVASHDGQRLFVAWEDMLWSLDAETLQIGQELRLPSPVDGMVQSIGGRELYLLPSTSGNLTVREQGMFTVDARTLQVVRHASDWPRIVWPFFFAAPRPSSPSD